MATTKTQREQFHSVYGTQKFKTNTVHEGGVEIDGAAELNGATSFSTETVAAGNGSGNAVALSTTSTVSFVTTATNSSHVSLADGVTGQVKIIVHKTRSNTTDLVITPANFAAGSTLTSNSDSRSVTLCFDGTNWQVIAGEITGTAEMVIG